MGKKYSGSDSGSSGSESGGGSYKKKDKKKDKYKEGKDKKDDKYKEGKDKKDDKHKDKKDDKDKKHKDDDKHKSDHGSGWAGGYGGGLPGGFGAPGQFPLHAPIAAPGYGGHSSEHTKDNQPAHLPNPHGPPSGGQYGQFQQPHPPNEYRSDHAPQGHHVQAPPAPPAGGATAPPSGYRVPLSTTAPFPPVAQTGQPVAFDLDGTPLFFGSALMDGTVQPCKIAPALNPPCRVPYAGVETEHNGRYDLLPFDPNSMELVRATSGQLPKKRLVEGGYESNGAKLYHAIAVIDGLRVPGKTGEHLGGASVPFAGSERYIQDSYEVLCWRF